jgi:hypothetical protein
MLVLITRHYSGHQIEKNEMAQHVARMVKGKMRAGF